MLKNILKVNGLMFLLIVGMMTSCTKEAEDVTPENFGETASLEIRKSLNAGEGGCLEVIFPINVTLPDGTNIEVSSFLEAKEEFKAWKEANPDVEGRPEIVYPVEVITSDGETVSVSERSELKALLKECKGNFGNNPRGHKSCFTLQFPVSVLFPDESTESYESKRDLKQALRTWKQENEDATEKPELVFPLVIVFEDDTTQTVNSAEELAAVKEACE